MVVDTVFDLQKYILNTSHRQMIPGSSHSVSGGQLRRHAEFTSCRSLWLAFTKDERELSWMVDGWMDRRTSGQMGGWIDKNIDFFLSRRDFRGYLDRSHFKNEKLISAK